MTINRIVRVVIALAGFAATAWGAIQADRLSIDGVDAGPWDWAGVIALFALSLFGVAARVALRTVENAKRQTGLANQMAAPLAAIGKESHRLIANGELAAAGVLLEAAKKLKGAQ